LAGAASLMCAFLVIEARSSHPMLPLGLFRNHAFTGVQIAAFSVSATLFALALYLTLYLQEFLGEGPLVAGEHFFALTGVLFVSAQCPPAGFPAFPRASRSALVGTHRTRTHSHVRLSQTDKWTALIPGLIVAGAGSGIVIR